MSGIVGCTLPGARENVLAMLSRIAYRGPAGSAICETPDATLGVAWTRPQAGAERVLNSEQTAMDSAGPGRLAFGRVNGGEVRLVRDLIGVAPLYFTQAGPAVYFASEIKALLPFSKDVHCLPPGHSYDGRQVRPYLFATPGPLLSGTPRTMARELRIRLASSVRHCMLGNEMASWLSGGLDSSVIAALARTEVRQLHTFAAGLPGASDLEYARVVARYIQSDHHEIQLHLDDMLAVLPEVIYHLESFDALLVRSSIVNYLAGREAAKYAPAILSGEGGDELFAGYAYLKQLEPALLADELLDITARLHNTALQRVDRCSAAHGVVAHVPFLAPDVVDYAFRIPVEYKLRDGVEKWILRQAAHDLLPKSVLNRTKAKFWEGAGVGDLLAAHAEQHISDRDFEAERVLKNGSRLHTKEELMYYRIFRRHFGEFEHLDWMGRTKGAPEVR
jgi:asparagine synthase (glutamine-hydrolysing)